MKNKLNRTLKFGILFFGAILLLWNCVPNEKMPNNEVQQEKKRTKISFEQFKSSINSAKKIENFNRFFDVNKLYPKTTLNNKNKNDFNNITILTENIIKITKDNFTTYTFTILTQTENYEFYNLVLYVNNQREIYKSYVLKYTPSKKWLTDKSQHFNGNVKIVKNDFFDTDNLIQSKSSIHAKSLANNNCIEFVTTEWICGAGNNHEPGHPNCTPENNAVTEYVITIVYGPCINGGGDNGDFNPETGDEGSSNSSGGGDGSIVTAPNTIPYTSELKNFLSGTLNSKERTYYSSDSNIKNTIDRYLIQKNFSNIAKFNAKLDLEFSESLNLYFQQFNWMFNNRDSQDLNDLKSFLLENNINTETEKFIKETIDAEIETNNNAEVDFDDQIINTLTGKALCIYEELKSSSTGFKNAINLFDGEFPVAHLKYVNSTTLPSNVNAQTSPPSNFLITIEINENNLDRPNLSIARTFIHETIHAEMFRKILSILDNGGDLDGLTRTEWLNKLSSGDYPGIYDYYVRFGVNDMQHEQMAAHYRTIIQNMLAEFQPGLSQNIYEALAWVGLKDTVTWNTLTDAEKNTINSTINTFNATGGEICN